MQLTLVASLVAILAVQLISCVTAEDILYDWKWGSSKTSGKTTIYGSERWHEVYPDCGGTRQSPVNIAAYSVEEECPDTELTFTAGECYPELLDYHIDEWGWKVSLTAATDSEEGSCSTTPSFKLNGKTYNLIQFHFHVLSEHTIGGGHSDAVVHFVHLAAGSSDDLRVIGVFLNANTEKIHETNEELEVYWDYFRQEAGIVGANEVKLSTDVVSPYSMLPASLNYYTYLGSLTTPPCSEIVTWMVASAPVIVSYDEINEFRSDIKNASGGRRSDSYGNTNRNVQPLNGRSISHCTPDNVA